MIEVAAKTHHTLHPGRPGHLPSIVHSLPRQKIGYVAHGSVDLAQIRRWRVQAAFSCSGIRRIVLVLSPTSNRIVEGDPRDSTVIVSMSL
jgi:hypothetical protein